MDYVIHIFRANDNKKLATVSANSLIGIYGSDPEMKSVFNIEDLRTYKSNALNEIKSSYDRITLLEHKQLLCHNSKIMESFDDRIKEERANINNKFDEYTAYSELIGLISGAVLDKWNVENECFENELNKLSDLNGHNELIFEIERT